jgi:5-phospho-D-xylono-1,4-lactonase
MTKVQTVLGAITPDQMGITYDHEHLLFSPPPPFAEQDTDLRLDNIETAIQEVNYFKSAGGRTLVEMTTVEMGRSPHGLADISKAAGLHIIAATGFNQDKFCAGYVADQSSEQLAAQMVQDLETGMDGTQFKAGLVKFSTSKDKITPVEDKIIQATILAHQRTGAPVSTHTEAGTMALEQIRRLSAAGISHEHITIGHLDRNLNWDMLAAVADSGVFMGFDQICKEKYYPDSQRIEMIRRLVEAGYASQILLSGDLARKSYWPSYGFGKGPGLTYILWRFVPWMLEAGIPLGNIKDMLIHNPARAFAWA